MYVCVHVHACVSEQTGQHVCGGNKCVVSIYMHAVDRAPRADLVPRPNVEEWLKHLRSEFPAVAFKASTQSQKENLVSADRPSVQHLVHTSTLPKWACQYEGTHPSTQCHGTHSWESCSV